MPGLVEQIMTAGAAVPRYSRSLNPIEFMWSKLKHLAGKARADTAEAVEVATERGCALDAAGSSLTR